MGRRWVALVFGTLAAGCHTVQHDTRVPLVEVFNEPPDEDRFNNPPERGYSKPVPKKEFVPGMSAGGGGPGGGAGVNSNGRGN